MKDNFRNKKIAILGLGVEGVSSVKFLIKEGAKVTVLDQKTGKDYLKNLKDFQIIVRSPGIKRNLPEILDAEKSGVVITSQTKIFFNLCPCPIIGVTGTKGKGTTSSLIYKMLKEAGKDAYLGGNIGQPPLDFLDKLSEQSIVVLELSSFQLQDLTKSPYIAVVLMITREHLDYHKDVLEYVDAKRNILRFQTSNDFAVINKDYPASNESDIHTGAKMFFVSRERECDEGCFVREGKIVIRTLGKLGESDGSVYQKVGKSDSSDNLNNRYSDNLSSSEFSENIIINTSDILLPGKHNWENVCAAVMAATLAGVSKQNIVNVLKTFKGLEHRLELVSEIDEVRYYDDSFSTTPETAIAAIEAFESPEILILGGSSKNSDFTELGKVIGEAKNIKAIIGIGEEWEKIRSKIKILHNICHPEFSSGSNFGQARMTEEMPKQVRHDKECTGDIQIIEGCKSMREVVVSAALEAEQGDVVLLSPACASFGMFKNYKDRGEQFKREVEKLKERASVSL